METKREKIDLGPDKRERDAPIESEVQKLFRDRTLSLDELAEKGIQLFGDKIVRDMEAQRERVVEMQNKKGNEKFLDKEVRRLLRMMEKRKQLLDDITNAMAIESSSS